MAPLTGHLEDGGTSFVRPWLDDEALCDKQLSCLRMFYRLANVGDVQYRGGRYHEYRGGYLEHRGG